MSPSAVLRRYSVGANQGDSNKQRPTDDQALKSGAAGVGCGRCAHDRERSEWIFQATESVKKSRKRRAERWTLRAKERPRGIEGGFACTAQMPGQRSRGYNEEMRFDGRRHVEPRKMTVRPTSVILRSCHIASARNDGRFQVPFQAEAPSSGETLMLSFRCEISRKISPLTSLDHQASSARANTSLASESEHATTQHNLEGRHIKNRL